MPRLKIQTTRPRHEYEIQIGRGLLASCGQIVFDSLGPQSRRLALISNQKVFSLYGTTAVNSLRAQGFVVATFLMGDGERFKSLRTIEKIVDFLSKSRFERTDGVIALGGGVVGDAAGFAASVYLRGVRYVHVPTSLLAQIDSSIGGKTGVNLASGKNLVGSFHPPSAVLVDPEMLASLPARELVAGWCECVKQGAIGGRKLFNATGSFLQSLSGQKITISPALERLIADHCAFKAAIVRGDEREDPNRLDRRSRRILNFGHTIGHALETVTGYKRFRHGEAVGQGMLVAGQLSKNVGLLDESELESLRQAIALCGPLPAANDIDDGALLTAITQDKKRTADRIKWVLLERIGRARIVDGAEISPALLRKSFRQVFRR